jgi:hypothetical protein
MPLYKNCGRWKYFDYIFGFSVKSYVRNIINVSWDKILLTSEISQISTYSNHTFIADVAPRKQYTTSRHCPPFIFNNTSH